MALSLSLCKMILATASISQPLSSCHSVVPSARVECPSAEVTYVFLVDKSRSMNQSIDYERLKKELSLSMTLIPHAATIMIIGFDAAPLLIMKPVKSSPASIENIQKRIRFLYPSLQSRLLPALQLFSKEKQTECTTAIIITDGQLSDSSEDLREQFAAAHKRGVKIEIILIGERQEARSFMEFEKAGLITLVSIKEASELGQRLQGFIRGRAKQLRSPINR